jgi:hypothetical protein
VAEPVNLEKKSKKIILVVESDKCESNPNMYCDYMVELENKLVNVTNIVLTNADIPFVPNIVEPLNKITIEYDDDQYEIEFEEGKHDVNKIIEQFNEQLNTESDESDENLTKISCGIVAKIENKKIVFEQKDNKNFKILCGNNSMVKYLGFTQNEYTGKSRYVAETTHSFIDNLIYLYITNISKTNPFAILYPDGRHEQKITLNEKISVLDSIIIQFKTDDGQFVNFGGEAHKMTFIFNVQ